MLIHLSLFETWLLAWHLIAMVAWFAALFYLPRLFVYHVECPADDTRGQERFDTMQRRLYRGIMWPAGIATTIFGGWLLVLHFNFFIQQPWMQLKLGLACLLWGFHLYCGHLRRQFAARRNRWSSKGLRVFNEVPTVLLIGIILAAIVH